VYADKTEKFAIRPEEAFYAVIQEIVQDTNAANFEDC
jgi:hypothetical protein